ncbi:MAG: hypothetical protein ABIM74_06245 [candidate division WOR-3 bacterium]
MDKLIATLSGFTEKVMVLKASEDMLLRWAKPYGDVYVLESLWKGLGLEAILSRIDSEKRNEFPLERAIFCMVYHRFSDPGSKLSLSEKLREEYLIEGSESLDLHHLYRALDDLRRRFGIKRAVFVCDRGMVSEANLRLMDEAGYDYITGLRMASHPARKALSRQGRYHRIEREGKPELWVKEAVVDGERYIICYNPDEAEREEMETNPKALIRNRG